MISSVIYVPQSQIREGSTFSSENIHVIKILAAKAAVILYLFIFSNTLAQQSSCIIVMLGVALEFWISKNLGRKYLHAYWQIDTSGSEDVWVYEASLNNPSQFQEIFWYSFLIYGIVLCILSFIMLSQHKYSLFCAILVGIVACYINFFAFSKIIKLRNQGIFQKIANQALNHQNKDHALGQTIRLPLIYKSKLHTIGQRNQEISQLKEYQLKDEEVHKSEYLYA